MDKKLERKKKRLEEGIASLEAEMRDFLAKKFHDDTLSLSDYIREIENLKIALKKIAS